MFEYNKELYEILKTHEGWVLTHSRIVKILSEYEKTKKQDNNKEEVKECVTE